MHRKQLILSLLFVVLAALGARAQGNSIKCESNDEHRHYCGTYNTDRITLERQISGSPCIQGRSWGIDRRGLWVDEGCRAYFRVGGYQGDYHGYGNDDDRRREGRDDNNGWWDHNPDDNGPPRGNMHGGNWERGGACFYKERYFAGSYFCMRRGEQRSSLSGYGDEITSIRVFGRAKVTVFDDRDFRGARQSFRHDIPDLKDRNVYRRSGHSWNDRISSVAIQ
jgi:hypothetical protein